MLRPSWLIVASTSRAVAPPLPFLAAIVLSGLARRRVPVPGADPIAPGEAVHA